MDLGELSDEDLVVALGCLFEDALEEAMDEDAPPNAAEQPGGSSGPCGSEPSGRRDQAGPQPVGKPSAQAEDEALSEAGGPPAASSSSDRPMVARALAAASGPAAPRGRPQGLALHTTYLPGGFVSYYSATTKSTARFQATCTHPAHGFCRLTRSSLAYAKEAQRPAQGRPLGLMSAWLAAGDSAQCPTKEDHEATVSFLSFEQRASAMCDLLAAQNGPQLAARERPKRDDEGDEPELWA